MRSEDERQLVAEFPVKIRVLPYFSYSSAMSRARVRGNTGEFDLTIINEGNSSLEFSVRPSAVSGGGLDPRGPSPSSDLGQVNVSTRLVRVAAGETGQTRIIVRPPRNYRGRNARPYMFGVHVYAGEETGQAGRRVPGTLTIKSSGLPFPLLVAALATGVLLIALPIVITIIHWMLADPRIEADFNIPPGEAALLTNIDISETEPTLLSISINWSAAQVPMTYQLISPRSFQIFPTESLTGESVMEFLIDSAVLGEEADGWAIRLINQDADQAATGTLKLRRSKAD